MPNGDPKQVVQRMAQLRQKYLSQLEDRKNILREYLAKSESRSITDQDRVEIINLSHKLAGTGSTYGFPTISSSAKKLEETLLSNPMVPHKQLSDLINDILESCDKAPAINDLLNEQAETQPDEDLDIELPESGLVPSTRPIILAIDDDPDILGILDTVLADQAKVILAHNTNEAYKILERLRPDLILLDDVMPGNVSGLQFLIEKKRDADIANVPAIMITASNRVDEVKRALLAGAIDYISKPFVPAHLTEKVLARVRQKKNSVLIADDDKDICSLLTTHFALHGFMVYIANDGETALNLARKEKPDLIILDRIMPKLDGIEVLKKLRFDPDLHKTPILILTAKGQLTDVKEGLQTGANDYVIKPFNPENVVTRATRWIKEVKHSA